MSKSRVFRNAAGEVAMEDCICVFMDILGYVEMQNEATKTGKSAELFKRIYNSLNRAINSLNEHIITPGDKWGIKIFTDNIILSYPLRIDHHESAIGRTARAIAQYQLEMAKDGFFIRGGISRGNLYIDNNLVYGDALLDAYTLESKFAVHPRIITSPSVKKLILEHFTYYATTTNAPQNDIFKLDTDNNIFVDYLFSCFEPIRYDEKIDKETILIHKQHVENGLRKYQETPSVFSKYLWLSAYHNSSIDHHLNDKKFDYLKINPSAYRTHPALICPTIISPKPPQQFL